MTMAAAAGHPGPGLAAGPSDHDLITSVLRPMAAGRQQDFDAAGGGGGFIHMADVYFVAPERLAERYAPAPRSDGEMIWYFICPARCSYRDAAAGAIGQGCWTSETGGVVRPVRGPDGRRVGQARALSYGARTAAPWAAVTRHGWCMVELALDEQGPGVGGGGDFVLCKLFRSTRSEASATASAPSMAVPALVSRCKRKAAVGDHPEAPPTVRQQLMMQRSF